MGSGDQKKEGQMCAAAEMSGRQRGKTLKSGLETVNYGLIFIYLNFYFGRLNVLPDWIGYLLLRESFDELGGHEPDVLLLKPLASVLAAYEAACWLAEIFGSSVSVPVFQVAALVVDLYFNYQFLTDLGNLAVRYGAPKCGWFFRLRNVQAGMTTFFALLHMPDVRLKFGPSVVWYQDVGMAALFAVLWCISKAVGELQKSF